MTYSKEIYTQAFRIIDERRNAAQSKADRRTDEIYEKLPKIEEINRRLTGCSIEAARAVLKGAQAKSELEKIAKISLELQNLQADILKDNGYPLDYMEPDYTCKHCRDTGYVEKNGKTVYCQCFLELLKQCACEEVNKLSPLSLSTFDTFKLEYYPYDSNAEGVSPYSRMSKIYNYCKNYAAKFDGSGRSLLMRGATGLGKTHLSLAIANEVLNKGYYVVYVSAPSILAKIDKLHFNYCYQDEEDIVNTLCECDLLIIDDLGTEFTSPYTKTAIYNIFNNRILTNKPMIISTNMTIRELEATYSQRFVSRIIGECDRLDFLGKDIRAIK